MHKKDPYRDAHLIVAAIRVLNHLESSPPTYEQIAELLKITTEEIIFICRECSEMGIIEIVEAAGQERLFIKNHTKIETIPKAGHKSRLDSEIEAFLKKKEAASEKFMELKGKQEARKKETVEKIDSLLKEALAKGKT